MSNRDTASFDIHVLWVTLFFIAAGMFILWLAHYQHGATVTKTPEQLLIYCGNTMSEPVREIADLVEQKGNYEILISKGGSGDLLDSIRINQIGDLYLPGSESYIKTLQESELIINTAVIGYNYASIIVPKGNPKKLGNDPAVLTDKKIRLVLVHPESGSSGKEAISVFTRRGIKDEAIRNVVFFTSDTKDLVASIINNDADAVIGWYGAALWESSKNFVDAIKISEDFAPKHRLVMGQLSFSKNKELANLFLETATSPAGQMIFKKHGFL